MLENVRYIEGLIEVDSEPMTKDELAQLYPHEYVIVEVLDRGKYNEITTLRLKYRGKDAFKKYAELCRSGYTNYERIYTTPEEDSVEGKLLRRIK